MYYHVAVYYGIKHFKYDDTIYVYSISYRD